MFKKRIRLKKDIKNDRPELHDFRQFLRQFSTDFLETLQSQSVTDSTSGKNILDCDF